MNHPSTLGKNSRCSWIIDTYPNICHRISMCAMVEDQSTSVHHKQHKNWKRLLPCWPRSLNHLLHQKSLHVLRLLHLTLKKNKEQKSSKQNEATTLCRMKSFKDKTSSRKRVWYGHRTKIWSVQTQDGSAMPQGTFSCLFHPLKNPYEWRPKEN